MYLFITFFNIILRALKCGWRYNWAYHYWWIMISNNHTQKCIYMRVMDGEMQLMLRKVSYFLIRTKKGQSLRDLFNNIRTRLWFSTEKESAIILIEFLGVVNYCNSVYITQTMIILKFLARIISHVFSCLMGEIKRHCRFQVKQFQSMKC